MSFEFRVGSLRACSSRHDAATVPELAIRQAARPASPGPPPKPSESIACVSRGAEKRARRNRTVPERSAYSRCGRAGASRRRRRVSIRPPGRTARRAPRRSGLRGRQHPSNRGCAGLRGGSRSARRSGGGAGPRPPPGVPGGTRTRPGSSRPAAAEAEAPVAMMEREAERAHERRDARDRRHHEVRGRSLL